MNKTAFNPDAPTNEYPAQKLKPVTEIPVAPKFLDLMGREHGTYTEAYQASVKTKLARIIRENRGDGLLLNNARTSDFIASEIMKQLTVAWS